MERTRTTRVCLRPVDWPVRVRWVEVVPKRVMMGEYRGRPLRARVWDRLGGRRLWVANRNCMGAFFGVGVKGKAKGLGLRSVSGLMVVASNYGLGLI